MVQITTYPLVRHLRADRSSYIQYFRKGEPTREGWGLAFWFRPDGASISEIPLDDRSLPFILQGQSADYQDLTVQGALTWRAEDPGKLGRRIDFTVDLKRGRHLGTPIDQINTVLVSRVRQITNAYLKERSVRSLLDAGTAPLQAVIEEALPGTPSLAGLGLEVVATDIAALSPTSELERALQTPTFEKIQQQADEATFARRALAVEKERAIAENELDNEIELAARKRDLIARLDANARAEAEARVEALRIEADGEAARIRVVDQARADMERVRQEVLASLPPATLLAMAAREFAGKLERVDSLTVTPDMLATFMSRIGHIANGPNGHSEFDQ